MGSINIMHINLNGLEARKTELSLYLAESNPDIICMNETKKNGKTYPGFKGYTLASFRDRSVGSERQSGGGVAIYVRSTIIHDDISPNINDITAINVKISNVEYAIMAYYCPPGQNKLDIQTLGGFANKHKNLVIMGDLNAKHQFYGSSASDSRGDTLFDFVERHDMMVANNPDQATKLSQGNDSLTIIDYAIISRNLIGRLIECHIGEDVGSDHLPLHLHIQTSTAPGHAPKCLVRPLARCNWKKFTDTLINSQSLTACTTQLDIDQNVLTLEANITAALDEACPLKEISQYNFQASASTVDLIRRKRILRKLAQKNHTLRRELNRFQRLVKARLDQEKLCAWHCATDKLNHLQGRHFWDSFKRLTQTQKRAHQCPKILLNSGVKTNKPQIVANEFAKTLQTAHKTHEGRIFDRENRLKVDKFIKDNDEIFNPNFDPPTDDHILMEPIDMEELTFALSKTKSRGSPGPDGLSFVVLKHLPNKPLQDILATFNDCLKFGYFPSKWKNAYGVMLPKPGKDPCSTTGYRPISLLNTVGKLFERILNRRLMGHLTDASFFNEWQRAYLPKKEASEIVYRLTEEIKETSNKKKWFTTAFSLDVEKAFDSVWHNGLRYKLRNIGLPEGMCRILSSFLQNRTISVRCQSALSTSVPLEAGTPQGSVLSPLLFLIYVNDMPLNLNGLRAGQFADDVTSWLSETNKARAQRRIQRSLNSIQEWCSKWRVKLNVEKTQLVTFNRSAKYQEQFHLLNEEIDESPTLKVLGVKISSRGSLLEHCKERAAMANQRIGLLRLINGKNWGANTKTLKQLYVQYIRPILEHGSVVTATATPSHIKPLKVAERKALRVILGAPTYTRNEDLHERSGIQPIQDRLVTLREKAIMRFGDSEGITQLEDARAFIRPNPG
jgi:exonuclease III